MLQRVNDIAFSLNSIQFYAAITGVIAVFLTARKNIWCWPIGIISTIISAYVYFVQQLPYEAFLQAIYLAMAIYGWFNWHQSSEGNQLKVERTPLNELVFLIATSLISGLALGYISYLYYKTPVSFIDALLTTFSLAANWLAAKRKIENWWFWIVIDSLSVGLYEYKEMHWFALLFVFFTLIATRGQREWKDSLVE